MSNEERIKYLEDCGAILKGHFILSDCFQADIDLQPAKVYWNANVCKEVCEFLAEIIKNGNLSFDYVMAPALGGIIFGYELAKQLDILCVFCERLLPERGNSSFFLRRGFDIPKGAKILIADDVVQTGDTLNKVYELVKSFEPVDVMGAFIIDVPYTECRLKGEDNIIASERGRPIDYIYFAQHLKDIPAPRLHSKWRL